jgi:hypothetical protein
LSKKKLIDSKELEIIERQQKSSPIHRYAEYKAYYDFNEGDVLVKYWRYVDYQTQKTIKEPVYVSQFSKVPKKYMVVHKDSVGFCWIKQISVKTGETIGGAMPIMSLNGYDRGSFEVDPEQATADLLGQDYSFKDQYDSFVKRKAEIVEANKTCLIKWPRHPGSITGSTYISEVFKLHDIKKGSKIWVGNNTKDVHLSNKFLEIKSMSNGKNGFQVTFTKESVDEFKKHSNVYWRPTDWSRPETMDNSWFFANAIYHSKPQSIDEL